MAIPWGLQQIQLQKNQGKAVLFKEYVLTRRPFCSSHEKVVNLIKTFLDLPENDAAKDEEEEISSNESSTDDFEQITKDDFADAPSKE